MAARGGIELGLLGPLAAWRDGAELQLGGTKQRAVLAVLAVERGRTVSTDSLIEALWPDRPPGRPQTAIQGYVSQLRKVLGPAAIATDASGYRLDFGPDQLDSAEFERRLAAAPKLAPAERAAELAALLELWRGPALADFAYDRWAQGEIARLEELRLVAVEARLDADLECGLSAELVGELEAFVREQPLREHPRGQLMLALYRAGRQAEALAAYAAAREALVDGLGIDPGPELQALHRAILNQEEELARIVPPAPTLRLPVPPTPLLGREADRAQLIRLFVDERARLVTLTGPGGIGKTRLSIDAAGELVAAFPDGVWFVELAALRQPEHVLPAIAATLDATGALSEHVGSRRLLLVLDNFEQVIEAARSVAELLGRCANLSVLVTSRERLHLTGEIEFALQPLSPAVAAELFVDRAGRLGVDIDARADSVAELCARLDGLPLAVELAAARTKLFTVDDLLARIGTQLELLSSGPHDAPERHRTLVATIEWSHALLSDAERDLFEGLAVFAGAFDLADVEAVLSADLETLAALVDKSLVARRAGEPGRFGMLATVREFALGRLDQRGNAGDVKRRHAQHILAEVARADELLAGPEQAAALAEIARRHDDIRAALDWAEAAEDAERVLGLVSASGWFWYVRGHLTEGRERLERALAMRQADTPALRATACMRAGSIADAQVDLPAAERFYREALEIRAGLGDRAGTFGPLNNLGNLALQAGDYVAARTSHQKGLELARELGESEAIGSALHNLALVHLVEEDPGSAVPLLEESLTHARAVGNTYGEANCHANLGAALVELGEHARAADHLAASVRLLRQLDATEVLAPTLEDLAALALATGDPASAARRLGAAAAVRAAVGSGAGRSDADRAERTERATRSELGDDLFEQEWADGRGLTLARALEFAESESAARADVR